MSEDQPRRLQAVPLSDREKNNPGSYDKPKKPHPFKPRAAQLREEQEIQRKFAHLKDTAATVLIGGAALASTGEAIHKAGQLFTEPNQGIIRLLDKKDFPKTTYVIPDSSGAKEFGVAVHADPSIPKISGQDKNEVNRLKPGTRIQGIEIETSKNDRHWVVFIDRTGSLRFIRRDQVQEEKEPT